MNKYSLTWVNQNQLSIPIAYLFIFVGIAHTISEVLTEGDAP